MAHQRKEIRHAIAELLIAAGTAAGSRVSRTRVDAHKRSELPAISVYALSESSQADGSAPRELARDARVEIVGWVQHTEAVPADDAMDDLAEQIETAMDADRFVGGLAADTELTGTEIQIRAEEGKSSPLVGQVTLAYAVTYRTSPTPPADLADFERAKVTHRIVGTGDNNAATEEFDV
jgi:hypothetical protein